MGRGRLARRLGLPSSRRLGLLVIGHGTTDPVGAAETAAVRALVAWRLPGTPVELGFLELREPTLAAAVARLAGQGCDTIVAAPLILQTAGHARRDIPLALADAVAATGIRVVQAAALGCHPSLVDLARLRRRQAVLGQTRVPTSRTALVVVGRGSSDPETPAQLTLFAARTTASDPDAPLHVRQGFVAAAAPRLDDALDDAARIPGISRVVVQPHLLFRGHVEHSVGEAVARARLRASGVEWLLARRLGAGFAVADALLGRALDALRSQAPADGPRQHDGPPHVRGAGARSSRQGPAESSE